MSVENLWYAPVVGKALLASRPPASVLLLLVMLSPILAFYIYYAHLHPLAQYPGPFWAKFSGLRAAYHAWIGDVHVDMWRLHEKYGPCVRYSPNYVLFNTTEAFKDIYSHSKNVQKSQAYLAMVHNTPSTFTLMDRHEHAWKKRILSQKLSDAAIRSFEPNIAEIVERFCAVLRPASEAGKNAWSEPFNMSEWTDHLFFDLVSKVVFGESFDLIRSPWYRHIPVALARSNERMSVVVQFPYVLYRRLDKLLFRDSVFGRKEFLRFVHNMVTERIKRGSGHDVFSGLLDAVDPKTGNSMTCDEIVAESILMLVAGSDTSSTLMSAMFFYLINNPAKRDRLFREVRTEFATRDEIHLGPKLQACRYLHACISESLRMAPPVAAAPFREVTKGGLMVDGHFLPAGANVGTGIFSIQHNERYFHDPYVFAPERWLADEKQGETQAKVQAKAQDQAQSQAQSQAQDQSQDQAHVYDAYVPFSSGPRVCLGKGLALAEMSLAMAHICWTMDFAVVESMKEVGAGNAANEYGRHRPGEFQLYDHITVSRNGPMVQFRNRDMTVPV